MDEEIKKTEDATKTDEKEEQKQVDQKDVNIQTGLDPHKELQGLIKEVATLASGINVENRIKERVEQLEEQIAKYKEASKRGGFAIPVPGQTTVETDGKDSIFPYNKEMQGMILEQNFKYKMPKEHLDTLAEIMVLAVKAGVYGNMEAQVEYGTKYGSILSREQKTGTTALGDAGNNSFPLPDVIMSEILHYAREKSVILQEATVVPVNSDKVSWPVESTGVSFTWGNTTSESTPTVTEAELDPEEVSAYCEVRRTLFDDTGSDITGWLTNLLVSELGQELDNQAFNGTGSPCSGLLTAKCGYSVNMGSGSAAFSMIGEDNLSEMISKLDGVRKEGAKFYFNGQILHYIRTLKDSQNRPIFINTIGSSIPPMIWGFPYREVVKMPSTSASNTAFVVFGNLKNFYVGRRLGVAALEVNRVAATPYTTNRIWFKLYNRWGLIIALPNAFVRLITSAS